MIESETEKTNRIAVHIRWMIRRDMDEVLQIESDSFDHPWYHDDFIKCLRERNCVGMVAETKSKILGFMIHELRKNSIHILNFAVCPLHRRSGIGGQMIAKLMGKLSRDKRESLTVAVRDSNLSAQLFFRDEGFKAVKVLRNYYDEIGEDAYLMKRKLP